MLTTWRGISRTLASRMETRASSLIIFFIYVDYHKQKSNSVCEDINVHEVKQMCGLQGFP